MHDKMKRTRAYSFVQGHHQLCWALSRVSHFLICSHDRSKVIHHSHLLNLIRCQNGRGSAAPSVEPRKIKKLDLVERFMLAEAERETAEFYHLALGLAW